MSAFSDPLMSFPEIGQLKHLLVTSADEVLDSSFMFHIQ